MIGSTVWAKLSSAQNINYCVIYIDPNTLEPTIDPGASGILPNFTYKKDAATNGAGVLSVGVLGDLTGTDPLSLGAQGDSYIPVGNQNPSTVGLVPGFSVSSSRGTRYVPTNSLDTDLLGEFAGYGLVGAASPLAYSKLAGISYYVSGASATLPGGEMHLGTRANASGVWTEWIKLDNAGAFCPIIASTPGTPLTPSAVKLGKAGYGWGSFSLDYNITATVGAVTINKPCGRVNIAAGASSVVVTNALVSPNSIVIAQLAAIDATLTYVKAVVPASGSFTITGNANATANCAVNFLVIGTDS